MQIVERFTLDGVAMVRGACSCGAVVCATAADADSGRVKSCRNPRAAWSPQLAIFAADHAASGGQE